MMFIMTDDRENKEKQNRIDIMLPDTKEVERFSKLDRIISMIEHNLVSHATYPSSYRKRVLISLFTLK